MKQKRLLTLLWMVALLTIPKAVMAENYFSPEFNATAFLVTPKSSGVVHIKCA